MKSFENEYLRLLRTVIDQGEHILGRNGNTKAIFGEQIKFDLSDGFPLLTTKRMFFKGIIGELLWFINGHTNAHMLSDKGIHIWDGNSSRESLDSRGLHEYEEGICGPIYGYQWRHFNAEYKPDGKPSEQGFDQLKHVVDQIRSEPNSRRILLTSWNPIQLNEMCLEPCHVLYQFRVYHNKLHCHMYQRSCDVFLGLPFNISSVSLLTILLSKVCNLSPGTVTISFGDVHLYCTHIDQAHQQIVREPFKPPSIQIHKQLSSISDLENLNISDIELIDYNSHPKISAKMVV